MLPRSLIKGHVSALRQVDDLVRIREGHDPAYRRFAVRLEETHRPPVAQEERRQDAMPRLILVAPRAHALGPSRRAIDLALTLPADFPCLASSDNGLLAPSSSSQFRRKHGESSQTSKVKYLNT